MTHRSPHGRTGSGTQSRHLTAATAALMLVTGLLWQGCGDPHATPPSSADSPNSANGTTRSHLKLAKIEPLPELPALPPRRDRDQIEIPPAAIGLLATAQRRYQEEYWSEAIDRANDALRVFPDYADARLLIARTAVRQHDDALADSNLTEVAQIAPRAPLLHYLTGLRLRRTGEIAAATQHFRVALLCDALPPNGKTALPGKLSDADRAIIHLHLGLALFDDGYLTAARDELTEYRALIDAGGSALRSDPELRSAMALYNDRVNSTLAAVYESLGDLTHAVELLQDAADSDPGNIELKSRWLRALAISRPAEEAEATIIRSVEKLDDVTAMQVIDEIAPLLAKPNRRHAILRELGGRKGHSTMALVLANELLESGDAAAASEVLATALKHEPRHVELLCAAARSGLRSDQIATALQHLRTAMEYSPANRFDQILAVIEAAVGADAAPSVVDSIALHLADDATNGQPTSALMLSRLSRQCGKTDVGMRVINAAWQRATREQSRWRGPIAAERIGYLREQKKWNEIVAAADEWKLSGVFGSRVKIFIAEAFDATDRLDDAILAYEEAAAMNTSSPQALMDLAEMLMRRARADALAIGWSQLRPSQSLTTVHAMNAIDRLLAQSSLHVMESAAHLNLRADAAWKRVLTEIDSRNPEAIEGRIHTLLLLDQAPAAFKLFQDAQNSGVTGSAIDRISAMLDSYGADAATSTAGKNELFRKAMESINTAAPDNAWTLLYLSEAWSLEGRLDKALNTLDQLLALHPDHVTARSRRVRALLKLLRYDEAQTAVTAMLSERPHFAEWQVLAFNVAIERADAQAALDQLTLLIGRDDLTEQRQVYRLTMMQLLATIGRTDECVAVARAMQSDSGFEDLARPLLLRALNWAGKFDEAVNLARGYVAAEPQRFDFKIMLVGQLVAAGRSDDAVVEVLNWIESDPGSESMTQLLGQTLTCARRYSETIALSQFFRIEPGRGLSYYRSLLDSHLALGHTADAVELIRTMDDGANPNVDYELAYVYLVTSQYAEAEGLLLRMIEPELARLRRGELVDTDSLATLAQQLALVFDRLGKPADGESLLTEVLAAVPDSPGINNDLGYMWADTGRNLEKAREMIAGAVAANPLSSSTLDSYGWVLYKLGDFDTAAKWMHRSNFWSAWDAIQQDRTLDQVPCDHYGDVLYRLNRPQEAAAWWNKALEAMSDVRHTSYDAGRDERLKLNIEAKLAALAAGEPVDVAASKADPAN